MGSSRERNSRRNDVGRKAVRKLAWLTQLLNKGMKRKAIDPKIKVIVHLDEEITTLSSDGSLIVLKQIK
jgi:hypothetical protein